MGDRLPRVEIQVDDTVVTFADVTLPSDADGTVLATFAAVAGHLPVGSRSDLVDAVMELPEVREHTVFDATVPLGDTETLQRLARRTEDMSTHAAGSTALVHTHLPSEA